MVRNSGKSSYKTMSSMEKSICLLSIGSCIPSISSCVLLSKLSLPIKSIRKAGGLFKMVAVASFKRCILSSAVLN